MATSTIEKKKRLLGRKPEAIGSLRKGLHGKQKNLRQNAFLCKELGDRFARSYKPFTIAVDEHFGCARPRVVVRAHRHSIGSRGHDGEQIARLGVERPVMGEEVAR